MGGLFAGLVAALGLLVVDRAGLGGAGRFTGGPGAIGTVPAAPGGRTGTPGARGGAMGGLLDAADVSEDVTAALSEDASSYTWAAAAVGSNNAAGYQLATQLPVMPVGGFNGSDPSPTLAAFQRYVADGRIHWFIGHGIGMAGDGGSSASQQIRAWVTANFEERTVDGVTMYDLSAPLG